MAERKVARVELDRAKAPIISGATTVFTNNKSTAFSGSVTAKGEVVIQGYVPSVFVEGKPIARAGDMTSSGIPIQTGSQNVFAGDRQ
jgi:uncharacterized Zn-binding protein involved in type VI secretion